MAQIKSEAAYRAAMKRIDELLKVVNDSTPADDPNYLELDMISDMVAEYEDVHYPISKPTLIDVIKLRLYEMGITQTKLAEMLGLSNARVSEIMNGKSEPSLKIGRELSRQLNIDPAVVLGWECEKSNQNPSDFYCLVKRQMTSSRQKGSAGFSPLA